MNNETVAVPLELCKEIIARFASYVPNHESLDVVFSLKRLMPRPLTNEELIHKIERQNAEVGLQDNLEWQEMKKRLREAGK